MLQDAPKKTHAHLTAPAQCASRAPAARQWPPGRGLAPWAPTRRRPGWGSRRRPPPCPPPRSACQGSLRGAEEKKQMQGGRWACERALQTGGGGGGAAAGQQPPTQPRSSDRCYECVGAGAGPHARARRPGGLLARSWLPGPRWAWLQSMLGPILGGLQSAAGAKEAQGPSPCGTQPWAETFLACKARGAAVPRSVALASGAYRGRNWS